MFVCILSILCSLYPSFIRKRNAIALNRYKEVLVEIANSLFEGLFAYTKCSIYLIWGSLVMIWQKTIFRFYQSTQQTSCKTYYIFPA